MGDYSQATHRAVIKIPDERLDFLAELEQPRKVTPAEIEFLDAPGFSGKGKEAGELDINPEVRMMDALIMVVDAFSPDAQPRRDIRDLLDEMILGDLTIVENNIEKKSKKMQLTGEKGMAHEIELLERCRTQLEQEQPLIDLDLIEEERKALRGFTFLSMKPLLIVINVADTALPEVDEIRRQYESWVEPGKRDLAVLCGSIEMELVALDDADRAAFMRDLGISIPAVEQVIHKSYELLGLISFLTVGKPEARAWTIKKGTNARKAAGAIHSDIERGFIRAEVTRFDDYARYKTAAALKAAGKSRLEGKDYVVQDGDVILFRFNV